MQLGDRDIWSLWDREKFEVDGVWAVDGAVGVEVKCMVTGKRLGIVYIY